MVYEQTKSEIIRLISIKQEKMRKNEKKSKKKCKNYFFFLNEKEKEKMIKMKKSKNKTSRFRSKGPHWGEYCTTSGCACTHQRRPEGVK